MSIDTKNYIEKFQLKGFTCYWCRCVGKFVLFYNGKLAEETFKGMNYNKSDYYGFNNTDEAREKITDFYITEKIS